ncbi:hypothetical protein NTD80_00505 [Pseudomonas sp. 13B_2.1_Bac1]|uniref:hypothetical protein n=1 Tax=Pseudomonas sp. 13B_2.1_Bac1 TaxID=2971624 RepID=UPI0021C6ED26|nr:hypothetical protein [Pseudomonas sp. 13B_2.1_Bac1]MCU1781218.1 hypothetical protein [Pseudomonas sp. 13B_2.1_Bac1]
MKNKFEDIFSQLQADIISLCLEYADGKVNDIYAYCSIEDRIYAFDVFYNINGTLYQKHQLNDSTPSSFQSNYDTSPERQSALLETGIQDLKNLQIILDEYDKPTPTEIKLHYNVDTGRLNSECKYEPIYTNHKTLTSEDVFDDWFGQVNKRI